MSKPSDPSLQTKNLALQTKKPAKQRAVRKGRWAEFLARIVLIMTGYRILSTNYKTPVGEIDIIANKKKTIAFVEVKARCDIAHAAAAVSISQQKRIQRAAEYFLLQKPRYQNQDIRFDVALVTGPLHITFVRDAWRP